MNSYIFKFNKIENTGCEHLFSEQKQCKILLNASIFFNSSLISQSLPPFSEYII